MAALDEQTIQQLRDAFDELRVAHTALAARVVTLETFSDTARANMELMAAKILVLESRKSESSGLIDTRVLGKPSIFEGGHEHWREWSFVFCGFVGAINPATLEAMLKAGNSDTAILLVSLGVSGLWSCDKSFTSPSLKTPSLLEGVQRTARESPAHAVQT